MPCGLFSFHHAEREKVNCTRRTYTHAYARVIIGGANVPVDCAGVLIKPGDIVCADDDGVLVIPVERAKDVVRFARMQLEDDHLLLRSPPLRFVRDDIVHWWFQIVHLF